MNSEMLVYKSTLDCPELQCWEVRVLENLQSWSLLSV